MQLSYIVAFVWSFGTSFMFMSRAEIACMRRWVFELYGEDINGFRAIFEFLNSIILYYYVKRNVYHLWMLVGMSSTFCLQCPCPRFETWGEPNVIFAHSFLSVQAKCNWAFLPNASQSPMALVFTPSASMHPPCLIK